MDRPLKKQTDGWCIIRTDHQPHTMAGRSFQAEPPGHTRISSFYTLASPLFLEGISSLHLSSLQRGGCRASGWTRNRGSVICWQPLPLVQPSHLMPTMKLLPHYLPDCQGGAPNQYTIHPFHLHWSGRLARACVSASAQTNRLVESSGVGWLTAHVCFWVVFYTGCLLLGRLLSPFKCIYR